MGASVPFAIIIIALKEIKNNRVFTIFVELIIYFVIVYKKPVQKTAITYKWRNLF